MKKKVLIDTDLGPDDYMAILMLLASDEIEVVGFSTVGGLADAATGADNLSGFLDFAGYRGYPIQVGADKPLLYDSRRFYWENYFNPVSGFLPPGNGQNTITVDGSCETFLHRRIIEVEEPVSLICLGPLTNIANLIKTYPEVKEKVENIVFTARYLNKKKVINGWNIVADPIASHLVVNSGIDLVIVGAEQDKSIPITPEMLEPSYQIPDNPMSRFLLELNRMTSKEIHEGTWYFWDQCTAATILRPEMAEWVEFHLVSENNGNWISAKEGLPINTRATLSFDQATFMEMFDRLVNQYSDSHA